MNLLIKIFFVIFLLVCLIAAIITITTFHRIYYSTFRLTKEQVYSYAPSIQNCEELNKCLEPGDILIRRYITKKTFAFDKFFHPYFTHSAFYLGNDYIVEATGKEKNPHDEIKINKLSQSDWMDKNIDQLIIIRPKNYNNKLEEIKNNLKNIADDPNYHFGLPDEIQKKAACADLIFNQLSKEGIFKEKTTKIITPDYLFWITTENSNNFLLMRIK